MRLHDDALPIVVISLVCAAVAYFFTSARHTLIGFIRSVVAGLLVGPPAGLAVLDMGYGTGICLAVTVVSAMFADYLLTGALKLGQQFKSNPSKFIEDLRDNKRDDE